MRHGSLPKRTNEPTFSFDPKPSVCLFVCLFACLKSLCWNLFVGGFSCSLKRHFFGFWPLKCLRILFSVFVFSPYFVQQKWVERKKILLGESFFFVAFFLSFFLYTSLWPILFYLQLLIIKINGSVLIKNVQVRLRLVLFLLLFFYSLNPWPGLAWPGLAWLSGTACSA